MKPYSMNNERGEEVNFLAHPAAVNPTISYISHTIPSKRQYSEMDTIMNKYELSEGLCDLLNIDWRVYRNMKQVTARLLAGGVFLNHANGEAIMLNTMETYGQNILGSKKQVAVKKSLPPPIDTKYKNVWPTTITNIDGEKLVVGTLSCNVLVTSSIRIDRAETPVVGASMQMSPSQRSDSLSTSIYLDKKLVELALNIAKNDKWPLTQSHTCHPYSVFTLFDFDMGRSSASKIFSVISIEVLKKGNKAQLNKEVVSESLENCKNESISKVLKKLLLLFNTDELSIPVLARSVINMKYV
ncbi:MAG: hypothetical protein EXX96DRAFT_612694 [Benjaminiella poitrasii]|nr:MAG: hypothetical protein EXX96DRAFT_612694 [Benjaminiella poitrasii]